MRLYSKLDIKQKLILNVSTSIVFLLLVFSIAGYFVNSMGKIINNFHDQPLNVLNYDNDINSAVYSVDASLNNLADTNDKALQIKYSNDIYNDINKIYAALDKIDDVATGSEGREVSGNTRKEIDNWRPIINEVMKYSLDGEKEKAEDILRTKEVGQLNKIQEMSLDIKKHALNRANSFVGYREDKENQYITFYIVMFIVICAIMVGLFVISLRSIRNSIEPLKKVMLDAARTGKLQLVDFQSKDEIAEMTEAYNWLVEKINNELWIKEGQTDFNTIISGDLSLKEFSEKATSFLARYIEAGSAVLYIYDNNNEKLILQGSYAYSRKNMEEKSFKIGQGIVGQVALEKKPILLEGINCENERISTGLFSEAPFNILVFPLVFEEKLLGVVEFSSFKPIDIVKQTFIEEISRGMSTNLFTLIQSKKIKELLEETKIAKEGIEAYNLELRIKTEETQKINSQLEEQQLLLQQQSEELQKTNSQMEEQQQLLQQQAEELQQTNSQLEEQQEILRRQSEEVKEKNHNLTEIQKELELRNDELEATSKFKSEFLANMSHELRTPLNSIILLSKLLSNNAENKLSHKDIEKMQIINRSGNELLRLINDILDVSKLEAKKVEVNYTCFNSYDLLQEFENTFSTIAEEKGLEFICEDGLKINIISDRERVYQIISNFLSNAFKFTEAGKVSLTISEGENGEFPVAISVRDTGIGIPKGKQKKIFEAFEQMDSSISRKFGGTGLGLSIAKQSCALLNGKIKLKSEEGFGSEFILYLPKQNEIPEIINRQEEIAASNEDIKYIMLVQNSEAETEKLKELLEEDEKVFILDACDENEAKNIIEKYELAAIITDLELKQGSGIELCRYVNKEMNDLPIIIYTQKDITNQQELVDELKKYSKSIIIKTENSIERLQDEVKMLFSNMEASENQGLYMFNMDSNIEVTLDDGKNILIVDDDPKNVYVLAAALEDCGVNVIQAENGSKAIEKLKETSVDLVLMDIMMPVMDGYECIRQIRNTEELKDLPIIALTAKALRDDRENCIEVGANDYISKPVDYDLLVTLIKKWLNN